MYESPIEMIVGQMQSEMEDALIHTVQKVAYKIDKDELIKALDYDREQYNKGYNDALNTDKWISCENALPAPHIRVLLLRTTGCIQRMIVGFYSNNNFWYDLDEYWDRPLANITHWQPLPKPPEVK